MLATHTMHIADYDYRDIIMFVNMLQNKFATG